MAFNKATGFFPFLVSMCLSLLSVCAVVVCLCRRLSDSSHLVQSTPPSDCMSSPVTHQAHQPSVCKAWFTRCQIVQSIYVVADVKASWCFLIVLFPWVTFTNWLSPALQAHIPSCWPARWSPLPACLLSPQTFTDKTYRQQHQGTINMIALAFLEDICS